MGDGGAAPMQVEIVEDACDPTDEFIARGENLSSLANFDPVKI